jgi:hypothetical protein
METRGANPADLAEQLRQVLGSIEAGELTCSAAMRHRIEGARLAVGALAASPGNDRMSDTGEVIMAAESDQH